MLCISLTDLGELVRAVWGRGLSNEALCLSIMNPLRSPLSKHRLSQLGESGNVRESLSVGKAALRVRDSSYTLRNLKFLFKGTFENQYTSTLIDRGILFVQKKKKILVSA